MDSVQNIEDGVFVAGEVKFNKLFIIPGDEHAKIDITNLVVELDLYEDLFSHTMTGSLTIAENFNLIHELPIIGEELIEVEFRTPSMTQVFTKTFSVYKIGRQITDANSKSVYLLNIISAESIDDLNTKISRSFSGTPNLLVKEIFDKYIKIKTEIEIEPAANLIKFVSPYWSPIKCINYVASKSFGTDKYRSPTFLFFESNQKFKFKSLTTMMGSLPVTEFYFDKNVMREYLPDGSSVRDIDREYKTIEKFDVVGSIDYIDRLMNGVYSFKVFDFDILHKTINKNVYNYWDDFEKTKHLSPRTMHSENVIFDDENCRIEWQVTNPYLHDTIKKDYSSEILSKRLPLLAQTEMFVVEITVPGRLGIECGDTVIMNMKNYSTRDSTDKNKTDLDSYYSGKYLITSIQHRMTKTRHKMNIQLIKDSFENDIEFKKEI